MAIGRATNNLASRRWMRIYRRQCTSRQTVCSSGDRNNQRFAEPTPYYGVILEMLKIIHSDTCEERLAAVSDTVTTHLFDANCARTGWLDAPGLGPI